MMGQAKVSVGGAVGYGLSLFAGNWRALWGVLALNALAWTVMQAGEVTRNAGLMLGGLLGALMVGVMVQGAVFRLAFADRHKDDPEFRLGPMGVQWRGTETRMAVAALLAALAVFFVCLLVALAALALVYGMVIAQGGDPAAALKLPADPTKIDPATQWPLLALQASVALAALYLGLRLTLVLPATADRKALSVFRTWKWTRGQLFRILGAALLIQLPFLLLTSLARGALPAAGTAPNAGEAMAAALMLGVPAGAVLAPVSAGLAAYFYRNLAPPPEPSST